MLITRIDVLAGKGTEEILDPEFYSLCTGVWVEEKNDGVILKCYPLEEAAFIAYLRGSGLPITGIERVEEEEKDYAALVRRHFTPIVIGPVTILPPWRKTSRRGHVIIIEPGMAFGTGRHESTKLMIRMMSGIDMKGMKVLDVGSGSGILALYARALGASVVVAIDHDPLAGEAIRKNIALNKDADIVAACADLAAVKGTFDIVLANLDFNTFQKHARDVVRTVKSGGLLIISGIEQQFARAVPSLFAPCAAVKHRRMKDWHSFLFCIK